MSVISKDLAGRIATKLTENSRIHSEKLKSDYEEMVTAVYEDLIPQEIKQAFKKYPEWIQTDSSVVLNSHGFNWERLSMKKQLPECDDFRNGITLTAKIADKLVNAKRKWENGKKKYKELLEETKQALLALKTYNNIRKEMPLAASMLPPPMSNALVVNFDSLKKRLNKQPEIKPETVTAQ